MLAMAGVTFEIETNPADNLSGYTVEPNSSSGITEDSHTADAANGMSGRPYMAENSSAKNVVSSELFDQA